MREKWQKEKKSPDTDASSREKINGNKTKTNQTKPKLKKQTKSLDNNLNWLRTISRQVCTLKGVQPSRKPFQKCPHHGLACVSFMQGPLPSCPPGAKQHRG